MAKSNITPDKLEATTVMKFIDPEIIRATTPLFLAFIGGVIAVAVVFSPNASNDQAKWASGFGLAGTAIAGAAGLAQPNKSESSVSIQKDGGKINVDGNS